MSENCHSGIHIKLNFRVYVSNRGVIGISPPHSSYKIYCRDLKALSVHPLLVYPTHYTGEEGYISDTEDTNVITHNQREKIEL